MSYHPTVFGPIFQAASMKSQEKNKTVHRGDLAILNPTFLA